MECTSTPNQKTVQISRDSYIAIRFLYYACLSYIKWHDEYYTEMDHKAVIRMNNQLEMIRDCIEKLENELS